MDKQVKLLLVIAAMLFASFAPSKAQTVSTQGKEFWVSFMTNGYKENTGWGWNDPWVKTQVLISAKHDCTGTISNPNTVWSQNFEVRAGNITKIEIPEEAAYHDDIHNESVQPRGLKIVTTDTTSVYCTNIANNSFDASYVLPIHALADDYLIQCSNQSHSCYGFYDYETSAILIVAAENNVTVDITPTTTTLSGHPAGEEFSIELQQGQTYQIRSQAGQDLSGTRVTARDCKKIAVFNGNTLTSVPSNVDDSYDHVFEQAMPLHSWGKNFVVTSSKDRFRDQVKITSSADNNQIFKNGESLTTLNANESYTFFITSEEKSCYIETDFPSAVYLYNETSDTHLNDYNGDPSMLWIAPIEQRINEITFATFNDEDADISNHYVNIIVKSEDITKVYFDDELVSPSYFTTVNGNGDYSCARMEISHDVHHISCVNGFNAHVYGFGSAKGYAYMVGSNASDLSLNILLNDITVKPNETFDFCIEEPVTFEATINFQNYTLEWDFGDGTTSTQNPATHNYSDRNLFNAKLIVTVQGGTCSGDEADTTAFFVDLRQHYLDPIHKDICSGEGYHENGFNIDFITNDTILLGTVPNPTIPVCLDSLLIYITANRTDYTPITDYRCWDGTYGFYNDYGFSFEYNNTGYYHRELQLENIFGCDSIVTLDLSVGEIYVAPTETIASCEKVIEWHNHQYTQEGIYYDTVPNSLNNCDSIFSVEISFPELFGDTIPKKGCDTFNWHNGLSINYSGIYSTVIPSQSGCDSTAYINLSMNYTPSTWGNPGEEIYAHDTLAAHQVITATEFQICTYTYSVQDKNPYCHWDSVVWSIHSEEGEEVNWILEPFVDEDSIVWSANLTVFNYIPGRIILKAIAYNECLPQGKVFQNWLVSSFYGIDDENFVADIHIVPNPNDGDMNLQFLNTNGSTDVMVYDMSGTLIDKFEANTSCYHYNMKRHRAGIYLFVFNHKGKIITRKVCID